jgi:hypothetical protein
VANIGECTMQLCYVLLSVILPSVIIFKVSGPKKSDEKTDKTDTKLKVSLSPGNCNNARGFSFQKMEDWLRSSGGHPIYRNTSVLNF